MMEFFKFLTLLMAVSSDRHGKYFLFCLFQFFDRYASAAYEDAAVWSRRLAEAYCNYVFVHFDATYLQSRYGLAELAWELPTWVYDHSASSHAAAAGEVSASICIGAPLSICTVYEDLDSLRRYGNQGAHADREFRISVVQADGDIVCRVLRIALSFMSLHRRLRARL